MSISILKFQNSGQRIIRLNEKSVRSEDGRYKYDVVDGVYILLPEKFDTDYRQKIAADFYASQGWSKNTNVLYIDTAAFLNERSVSRKFTGACTRAVGQLLPKKGR